MARTNPKLVAFFLWLGSSFPAAIDMKIILSIPKTISRKVNVNKAIQASGFVKISNMVS